MIRLPTSLRLPLIASISVVACGGDSTTLPGNGSPTPVSPSIASIQPTSLSVTNLVQAITIVGSGFDSSPTVTLSDPSGVDLQPSSVQLTSASSTSIATNVLLATIGTWRVQIKNANGQSSNAFPFTVGPALAPVIQSIAPANIPIGVTTTVTVTGSGFQRGLSLLFARGSGADVAFQGNLIQSLTSTSFAFPVFTSGRLDYDLLVVNPDGQSSARTAKLTAGTPPGPAPIIAAIAPTTIHASTLGELITISGSNFQPLMQSILTSPDGLRSTQLVPLEPPTTTGARYFPKFDVAGTWTLEVLTSEGRVSTSIVVDPPDPNRPPQPTLTSVSPSGLAVADAEQVLTLAGTGFRSGLTVELRAQNGGVSFAGRVVAVTPTAVQIGVTLVRSGSWIASIRNPDYVSTNFVSFNVAPAPIPAPVPVLDDGPIAIKTGFADQTVVIRGNGFGEFMYAVVTPPPADLEVPAPVARPFGVYINSKTGELRGSFDRAGTWHVRVANGSLESNTIDLVASYPTSGNPPTITGLDPAQPYSTPYVQMVHVNGTNFLPGLRLLFVGDDSVRFATPNAAIADSVTPTSFRLTANLGATGRLQVQNPDGRVSNILRFTRQPSPPILGSVLPTGPILVSPSPQTIRVLTTFVQTGATLTLTSPSGAGQPVSNVVIAPGSGVAGSVTFDALLDAAGGWRVRLTNPDGLVSNQTSFQVYAVPAPTITDVSPASPQADHAPQTITVQGTGFVVGTSVEVRTNNLPIAPSTLYTGADILNLSPTSFQVNPSLYLGSQTWTVIVHNPDGQNASRTFFVSGTTTPPAVASIDPAPVKGVPRIVTIRGANFHPALEVVITAPNGKPTAYTSAINIMPASFQLFIGFDQSGTWSIAVQNVDRRLSPALTFAVP